MTTSLTPNSLLPPLLAAVSVPRPGLSYSAMQRASADQHLGSLDDVILLQIAPEREIN